jgi:hypothetical protein
MDVPSPLPTAGTDPTSDAGAERGTQMANHRASGTVAVAAAPPRRWNASQFVPPGTAPVLHRDLVLRTGEAQKDFLYCFHRAQLALWCIEVKIPRIGSEALAQRLSAEVAERIDATAAELDRECARLCALMSDRGAAIGLDYVRAPLRLERLPHYTHQALTISSLFEKLDTTCDLLHQCWFLGRCPTRELKVSLRHFRQAVLETCAAIHHGYVTAKRALRPGTEPRPAPTAPR